MHSLSSFAALADLVVISHSGGKDSQAATNLTLAQFPAHKVVLVHAPLPGADWEGIEDHIRASHPELPLYTRQAVRQDGPVADRFGKQRTLLNTVEERGKWPSSQQRWCTSFLKRDNLAVLIRQVAKERSARNIIVVEGIRAAESDDRAQQSPWGLDDDLSKAGRVVYRWLPAFELSRKEVMLNIAQHGQTPHPAYLAGMTRLSCCFCVLASKEDLATAARLQPEKLAEIVALERKIGHTFKDVGTTLDRYIAGTQGRTSNAQWDWAVNRTESVADLAAAYRNRMALAA